MPHFSLKHSIVAVVLAAFLAVNVAQVPVVFADAISTYSVDEKSSDLGLMGADVKDTRDLVAIVVSEDAWNNSEKYVGLSEKYNDVDKGRLQDRVKRYAEDVQKALPKTNTIIIPVSAAAESVLKVQQVLEKLYLGGQKVNGNATQLSGVVLIGNVPLPVVTKGSQSFISMLPYTDFVEPSYVFDAGLQKYVRSPSAPAAPKAEIWHGVIHPPVAGNEGMKQLAEYLDKNHLYHLGNKDFSDFNKKILYSDLVAESKNMNHASFPRYQQFLKDMEDLVYSRFSAKWLASLQKQFDGATQAATGGDQSKTAAGITDIPDIQTVQPIQSYHITYPELFGTFLNTVTDFATGSGRWSEDDIESIPSLIAKKDAFVMATVRDTNDAIEAKIDAELEAVQKPLPLYHDVTIDGVVRYQNPGKIGLLKSIASTLAGNITSKDYLIGDGKFVFTNNSIIAGIQYVNGVASGDITRAQQCSTYGGSVEGGLGSMVGILQNNGVVSQMVRFIRSLNPLTINVSGATGAAGESDNAKNPGLLPSLGVTTRALSSSEASKLSGGNILHGALVEADKDLNLPAKFAPISLNAGDILLDLDGVTIDEEHPIPSLLQTRSVGEKARVGLYREGKNMSVETPILDANSDALVAGCYGINFTNEQNVIAGKEARRCFPLAATYPTADHAGTTHIASIAGLSDMDRGLSCTSFRGQKQFDTFITEARKYMSDSRDNGPSGLILPNLPTQDPAKILLLDKAKSGILGAPQDFSFQQFLDLQGVMNQQDDNGDYYDTNGNGKVDQIAWIDYNGNGKLDLWVNPNVTGSSVNVVSLPGEDDVLSSLFSKLPASLSVEEYKAKFPQFFQGSKYVGPYTGEFVGGDFGVDDPSELGYGYKAAGTSEAERWSNIQKKYLEIDSPVVYATPRRAPTQQEYRAHLQAMQKNHPSLKIDVLNLLYGGSSCITSGTGCEDELLQIDGLRKSTSDIWMRFTSQKEKDISSVGYHKEPTAATLGAQFKGVLSTALPIDRPRHATFLDKTGLMKTFIYPNAFSVSTYDELIQWRGLSLDQKHTRVMQEYLNPSIDGYVDDSPLGYEAMYFVANGKPTSYSSDFSGEGIVSEDDLEYTTIMGGDNVKGTGSIVASAANGVSIDTQANTSSTSSTESNSQSSSSSKVSGAGTSSDSSDPDVVDIDKWFPAIEKWLDNLKNSFKPLGLSLTDTAGYDALVAPGSPLQSLKLSIPKTNPTIEGDSVVVDVIGFDSKGSLATNDHTSLVRLDVAGLDATPESAKVIPSASDMPDGGVFLSQGYAHFQIVPGKKPQTIVVRARASVSGNTVSSDSVTLKITETDITTGQATSSDALSGVPHSVSVSSENTMLISPAVLPALPQTVAVSLSDISGHRVEGQLASYDITVSGPVSVSGIGDLDPNRPGYQVESMGDPVLVLLTPTATSGEVTISAASSTDDGSPITGTLTLPIRNDLHIDLSSSTSQLKADGTSVAVVTATVRDAGGAITNNFSGPVHFSVDDDHLGTFSSQTPTHFSKGQAVVTLQSATRSGNVSVIVDGSGLASAKTSIGISPLQAASIQIVNGIKTLALATGNNVVVNVVDQYGNLATDNSLPLEVRLTAKTAKYGNLRSANGTLGKSLIIYAQHGTGAFMIQASDTSGPIHIVVSSPGLNGAAQEIITSGQSGNGIISGLNPSVLYASLLGGPFGKVSEKNYLAGAMLFSGKMEAAAALSTDAKPQHNLISIGAYGGVTVYDSAAAVRVLNSGEGEPLRMSLTTSVGKNTVGELIIKRDGKASDYVSMVETEGKAYTFAPAGASNFDGVIRDSDKDLLRIYGAGGVQILDPSITVTLSAASVTTGKFISLDVSSNGNVIATIRVPFDAVNPLALLNAPPTSYQQLPTGVWLINQIHSENYIFEPSYTGFSSGEPSGYKLVSTLTTDVTADDTIGSSSTSLEDAATTSGIGFAGDNKHMLLLAAGNTVGESHKPYPSEIGIILGDPTVRLPSANTSSALGFSMDLGKSIGSITQGAKVLLPLDVNNDGKKDLLVGNEDGSIRYFQYTGGSETYRDRGELLRVKHGIYDAGVADIDGDGDEDIVVATKESCTTKETCVDIYRNNKGTFTRENLGLTIEPDRRVAVLRLVDMNADGVPDLLVSLTNGEIRVFYNDGKGVFEHTGQLIGSFNVSPGQRVLLSANTSIAQSIDTASVPSIANDPTFTSDIHDTFADIFAQPEGSANAMLVYFVANGAASLKGGHVMYRKIEVPAGITTTDAMDKLKGDLSATLSPKDATGTKGDLSAAGKGMGLLINENNKDSNHDGIPDYIDGVLSNPGAAINGVIDKASTAANSVKSTIKKLRCGEGCLPLPVNFAFLAPGPINIKGVAAGDDPVAIPVFGAAGGCTPWPIWPPCPYQNTSQTFRIYVSPTLTGQVGFGICFGGSYKNGQCYAFAPNISFIPEGLCKAVSQKMSAVLKNASSFGSGGGGGSGFTSTIAGGGKKFPSTDTTNKNSNTALLQGYGVETNVAANIRVPGFPAAFTDWIDRQIEEILDKLTDLPDLYLMYPQLSSLGRAVIPQMSSGKIAGYSTFLAWLNSVPLIKIEPKPVLLILPSLTKGQILKLQANLAVWLNDFNLEIFRLKSLFGCDKETKDKHFVDVCGLIDVKSNIIFKKIDDNFRALNAYKEFPKKLLQYRNIEAKYIRQIINYLTTVSQFLGGYVRRQEKRLGAWIDMVTSIKKVLAQWQAVIDITQKYATNCDSCKTERGSLFPMLLNALVNIPAPPIIPFPKWPDIIMDFSRVETGVNIVWPDLTFAPKQILLPTLPSIKFPIDANLLAELGGVNISKITLDLGAAFDSLIPVLPALPSLPSLPNLPDLPPLPTFKLPDIPPAPRIPGLDKIKGVNLKKALASIKDLLEVVCLIKKGYYIVDEDSVKSNLKTMIEQLTQRSLTPPLSIDLEKTVTYPPIKYNAVEQIILRGKLKFEIGTDVIYNTFKSFADDVNSKTTDLVRGVNSLGQNVGNAANTAAKNLQQGAKNVIKSGVDTTKGAIKTGADAVNQQLKNANTGVKNTTTDVNQGIKNKLGSFDPRASQIHLVAEQIPVDISTLPNASQNGDTYSANASGTLSHQLERYLANTSTELSDGLIASSSSNSPLSRYTAQAGESDMALMESPKMVALATGDPSGATAGADTNPPATLSSTMENYAQDVAQPVGIYLSNPATGNAEKLLAYTLETGRDPILSQIDVDNDGDTDVFYSFGGDIYFKENQTKHTSDNFNQIDTSSPMVSSLNDLLPVAGAVTGVSFDDSQRDLITLSWNASGSGVIGYELDTWSIDTDLQKRQYLFPSASGQIPYNAHVVTEEIADSPSLSVSLSLPYGNTYFQIVPLGAKGAKGTPSSVYLFAPQICGNSAPPLSSVEGGVSGDGTAAGATTGEDVRSVALGKTLRINLSGIIDAKSEIVKYYADTDLSKDSNGDGNPENDNDVSSTLPSLEFGPYYKDGDVRVNIFAENAHGTVSQQTLGIRVYVPNIYLKHASTQDGSAQGYISPGEGDVPFALVRERGGSAEIIGDYTTDSVGNFSVSGLQTAGKTVIRNIKNEVVAEYERETGKFHIVKEGYTLRARVSAPGYLATVEVVDPNDVVLASSFAVPDANTDVTIDPTTLSYTPITTKTMKGVHIADRDANDSILLKSIPADDPAYFGGTEVISRDSHGDTRLALVDSSGHILITDSRVSIRLRDVPDMPYAYELLLDSKIIGEIFIATNIPSKPIILDPAEFSVPASTSVEAQVAAIPADSLLPSSNFSDITKGTDLYRAVSVLQNDGIIEGYQENGQQVFKPDQAILRAEYTKIVLKALCIVPRPAAYQSPSPFSDITFSEPPSWFYPFVKESFLLNLITGYVGEKNSSGFSPFKPLSYISRAESVKILIEALRMLRVIRLDTVTAGANDAWYAPFMKVAQDLTPYTIAPTSKSSTKTKESFIVTPVESLSPDYRMTRGDFAIMAARVLNTYDCYKDARDAQLKKLQEDAAQQQKTAQEAAQKASDAKRSAAFTQLQKTLAQKTSKLSPGVYAFLPICTSCPCASVIDNTGQLLPGDRIFAILSTKDHGTILKKSNVIILPVLPTSL
ncbi:MAG: FG-GAP-like repeat-containing protein [Candidatus Peregrinibacteria bacterium]|nr:FG-GAP-like repeat-containing protein [Candidatus Peregrinibacteria bacterium]